MAADVMSGVLRPLKEVFKTLDLTLELVEKIGRCRSFKLRCRIGWPNRSACYYNRDFKLKYVRVGAEYARPIRLNDCTYCEEYSAVLYAEECGHMRICAIQPTYADGQTGVLDQRLSIQRCVDVTCQRIFLFFYMDRDSLDPAFSIREPGVGPGYVCFRMPRDSDFDEDNKYEYHCLND